eukprot:jgi/Botrbrau1/20389/Bobra.0006s0050.1
MVTLRGSMTAGWKFRNPAVVVVLLVCLFSLSHSQAPGPISAVNYGYTATLASTNPAQSAQDAPVGTAPLQGCTSPAQCRSYCPSTSFADLPAGEAGMALVPQQLVECQNAIRQMPEAFQDVISRACNFDEAVQGLRPGSRAPLALVPALARTAQGQALEMATHNFISSSSWVGTTPAQRIKAAVPTATRAAEIVAGGQHSVLEVIVTMICNPDRRAVLQGCNYDGVGWGAVRTSDVGGAGMFPTYFVADQACTQSSGCPCGPGEELGGPQAQTATVAPGNPAVPLTASPAQQESSPAPASPSPTVNAQPSPTPASPAPADLSASPSPATSPSPSPPPDAASSSPPPPGSGTSPPPSSSSAAAPTPVSPPPASTSPPPPPSPTASASPAPAGPPPSPAASNVPPPLATTNPPAASAASNQSPLSTQSVSVDASGPQAGSPVVISSPAGPQEPVITRSGSALRDGSAGAVPKASPPVVSAPVTTVRVATPVAPLPNVVASRAPASSALATAPTGQAVGRPSAISAPSPPVMEEPTVDIVGGIRQTPAPARNWEPAAVGDDSSNAVWTPSGTAGGTSFQQQGSKAAPVATPTAQAQHVQTMPQPQAAQAQGQLPAGFNPRLPQLPPLLPQNNMFRAGGAHGGLPMPQQLPVPQGTGPHGPSFLQLLEAPLNAGSLRLPTNADAAPKSSPTATVPMIDAHTKAVETAPAPEAADGKPCATSEALDPGVEALVKAVHAGQMAEASTLLAQLQPPAPTVMVGAPGLDYPAFHGKLPGEGALPPFGSPVETHPTGVFMGTSALLEQPAVFASRGHDASLAGDLPGGPEQAMPSSAQVFSETLGLDADAELEAPTQAVEAATPSPAGAAAAVEAAVAALLPQVKESLPALKKPAGTAGGLASAPRAAPAPALEGPPSTELNTGILGYAESPEEAAAAPQETAPSLPHYALVQGAPDEVMQNGLDLALLSSAGFRTLADAPAPSAKAQPGRGASSEDSAAPDSKIAPSRSIPFPHVAKIRDAAAPTLEDLPADAAVSPMAVPELTPAAAAQFPLRNAAAPHMAPTHGGVAGGARVAPMRPAALAEGAAAPADTFPSLIPMTELDIPVAGPAQEEAVESDEAAPSLAPTAHISAAGRAQEAVQYEEAIPHMVNSAAGPAQEEAVEFEEAAPSLAPTAYMIISAAGPAQESAESEEAAPSLAPTAHMVISAAGLAQESVESEEGAPSLAPMTDMVTPVAGPAQEEAVESEEAAPSLAPLAHISTAGRAQEAAPSLAPMTDMVTPVAGPAQEEAVEYEEAAPSLAPTAHMVNSAAGPAHEEAVEFEEAAPSLAPVPHMVISAAGPAPESIESDEAAPTLSPMADMGISAAGPAQEAAMPEEATGSLLPGLAGAALSSGISAGAAQAAMGTSGGLAALGTGSAGGLSAAGLGAAALPLAEAAAPEEPKPEALAHPVVPPAVAGERILNAFFSIGSPASATGLPQEKPSLPVDAIEPVLPESHVTMPARQEGSMALPSQQAEAESSSAAGPAPSDSDAGAWMDDILSQISGMYTSATAPAVMPALDQAGEESMAPTAMQALVQATGGTLPDAMAPGLMSALDQAMAESDRDAQTPSLMSALDQAMAESDQDAQAPSLMSALDQAMAESDQDAQAPSLMAALNQAMAESDTQTPSLTPALDQAMAESDRGTVVPKGKPAADRALEASSLQAMVARLAAGPAGGTRRDMMSAAGLGNLPLGAVAAAPRISSQGLAPSGQMRMPVPHFEPGTAGHTGNPLAAQPGGVAPSGSTSHLRVPPFDELAPASSPDQALSRGGPHWASGPMEATNPVGNPMNPPNWPAGASGLPGEVTLQIPVGSVTAVGRVGNVPTSGPASGVIPVDLRDILAGAGPAALLASQGANFAAAGPAQGTLLPAGSPFLQAGWPAQGLLPGTEIAETTVMVGVIPAPAVQPEYPAGTAGTPAYPSLSPLPANGPAGQIAAGPVDDLMGQAQEAAVAGSHVNVNRAWAPSTAGLGNVNPFGANPSAVPPTKLARAPTHAVQFNRPASDGFDWIPPQVREGLLAIPGTAIGAGGVAAQPLIQSVSPLVNTISDNVGSGSASTATANAAQPLVPGLNLDPLSKAGRAQAAAAQVQAGLGQLASGQLSALGQSLPLASQVLNRYNSTLPLNMNMPNVNSSAIADLNRAAMQRAGAAGPQAGATRAAAGPHAGAEGLAAAPGVARAPQAAANDPNAALLNARRAFGTAGPAPPSRADPASAVANAVLPLQQGGVAIGNAITTGALSRSNPVNAAVGSVTADQLGRNYPQGVAQAASELTGATLNAVQHATADIIQFPAAAVANTARLPSELASAASGLRQANPLPQVSQLPQPAPLGGGIANALGRGLPTGALPLASGLQDQLQAAANRLSSTVTAAAGPIGAILAQPSVVPGLLGDSRPTNFNLPFFDIHVEGSDEPSTAQSSAVAPNTRGPARAPAPAQWLRAGNNVIARAANRAQALEQGVKRPATSALPTGPVLSAGFAKPAVPKAPALAPSRGSKPAHAPKAISEGSSDDSETDTIELPNPFLDAMQATASDEPRASAAQEAQQTAAVSAPVAEAEASAESDAETIELPNPFENGLPEEGPGLPGRARTALPTAAAASAPHAPEAEAAGETETIELPNPFENGLSEDGPALPRQARSTLPQMVRLPGDPPAEDAEHPLAATTSQPARAEAEETRAPAAERVSTRQNAGVNPQHAEPEKAAAKSGTPAGGQGTTPQQLAASMEASISQADADQGGEPISLPRLITNTAMGQLSLVSFPRESGRVPMHPAEAAAPAPGVSQGAAELPLDGALAPSAASPATGVAPAAAAHPGPDLDPKYGLPSPKGLPGGVPITAGVEGAAASEEPGVNMAKYGLPDTLPDNSQVPRDLGSDGSRETGQGPAHAEESPETVWQPVHIEGKYDLPRNMGDSTSHAGMKDSAPDAISSAPAPARGADSGTEESALVLPIANDGQEILNWLQQPMESDSASDAGVIPEAAEIMPSDVSANSIPSGDQPTETPGTIVEPVPQATPEAAVTPIVKPASTLSKYGIPISGALNAAESLPLVSPVMNAAEGACGPRRPAETPGTDAEPVPQATPVAAVTPIVKPASTLSKYGIPISGALNAAQSLPVLSPIPISAATSVQETSPAEADLLSSTLAAAPALGIPTEAPAVVPAPGNSASAEEEQAPSAPAPFVDNSTPGSSSYYDNGSAGVRPKGRPPLNAATDAPADTTAPGGVAKQESAETDAGLTGGASLPAPARSGTPGSAGFYNSGGISGVRPRGRPPLGQAIMESESSGGSPLPIPEDPQSAALIEGTQSSPSPSGSESPLHIPAIPISTGSASPGTSDYYNAARIGGGPATTAHGEAADSMTAVATSLPSEVLAEPVHPDGIPAPATGGVGSVEGIPEGAESPAAVLSKTSSQVPDLLSAPAVAPFAGLMPGVAQALARDSLGEAPKIPQGVLEAIVKATVDGRTWDFVPALVPDSTGQLTWDLVPALLNDTQATRQSQILAQLLRTAGVAQQAGSTFQAAAKQLAKAAASPAGTPGSAAPVSAESSPLSPSGSVVDGMLDDLAKFVQIQLEGRAPSTAASASAARSAAPAKAPAGGSHDPAGQLGSLNPGLAAATTMMNTLASQASSALTTGTRVLTAPLIALSGGAQAPAPLPKKEPSAAADPSKYPGLVFLSRSGSGHASAEGVHARMDINAGQETASAGVGNVNPAAGAGGLPSVNHALSEASMSSWAVQRSGNHLSRMAQQAPLLPAARGPVPQEPANAHKADAAAQPANMAEGIKAPAAALLPGQLEVPLTRYTNPAAPWSHQAGALRAKEANPMQPAADSAVEAIDTSRAASSIIPGSLIPSIQSIPMGDEASPTLRLPNPLNAVSTAGAGASPVPLSHPMGDNLMLAQVLPSTGGAVAQGEADTSWVSWLQRIMTGPAGTTPIPQTAEAPEVLAILEAGTPPAPVAEAAISSPARQAADDVVQPHPLEAASAGVPADVKPMNSASMFRGRRLSDEGGQAGGIRATHAQVVALGDDTPYWVETDSTGVVRLGDPEGAPEGSAVLESFRDIWSRIGVTLSRLWSGALPPQAEDGEDSLLAA